LLARLSALTPETEVVDGLEWKSVISATLGSGGRARNVIPDRLELNLNHRFGPGTSVERAQARVHALVAGEAEVHFIDVAPSAPPRRDHPLIAALEQSGVAALEPKQAWTDVARFSAAGVPAANFGPGVQAQAHQKNEWTLVLALDTGKVILDRWLARIGGTVATLAMCAGALSGAVVTTGCAEGPPPSTSRSDAVTDHRCSSVHRSIAFWVRSRHASAALRACSPSTYASTARSFRPKTARTRDESSSTSSKAARSPNPARPSSGDAASSS
jgi:hypothetical protein